MVMESYSLVSCVAGEEHKDLAVPAGISEKEGTSEVCGGDRWLRVCVHGGPTRRHVRSGELLPAATAPWLVPSATLIINTDVIL